MLRLLSKVLGRPVSVSDIILNEELTRSITPDSILTTFEDPPPPPPPPPPENPTGLEKVVIQVFACHAHVVLRENLCQRALVRSKKRRMDPTPRVSHSGDADGVVVGAIGLIRLVVGKEIDDVDDLESRLKIAACFLLAWKANREDLCDFWIESGPLNSWVYLMLFCGCHSVSSVEMKRNLLADAVGEMKLEIAAQFHTKLFRTLFLHPLGVLERRIETLVEMDPASTNDAIFGLRIVAGYELTILNVCAQSLDRNLEELLIEGSCVLANVLLYVAASLLQMGGIFVDQSILRFCAALDPGTLRVVHQSLTCHLQCAWVPPLEDGEILVSLVKTTRVRRLEARVSNELKKWY
jgi:hypothetical protein